MHVLDDFRDVESRNLQQMFPDLKRRDFRRLKNGNWCVNVRFATKGKFACGVFDVLLEFPASYPSVPPMAWVQKPLIPKKTPHVYKHDNLNHANICYLRPKKDWHFHYTSFEASTIIETWIVAYCKWKLTGNWDWPEAGFFDHLI